MEEVRPRAKWRRVERVLVSSVVLVAGCAQIQSVSDYLTTAETGPNTFVNQSEFAGAETQASKDRFRRFAALQAAISPRLDQVMLPRGAVSYTKAPVTVVRVVLDESVLFEPRSDTVRGDASALLDRVADNMRKDVPGAALTVLAHTDASASDAESAALSQRQAGSVMQALAQRGVPASHLSGIAIGKRQPVAPNDLPDGRARNRRVELLISDNAEANDAVVVRRIIPASYYALAMADTVNRAELDTPVRILALGAGGQALPVAMLQLPPLPSFMDTLDPERAAGFVPKNVPPVITPLPGGAGVSRATGAVAVSH